MRGLTTVLDLLAGALLVAGVLYVAGAGFALIAAGLLLGLLSWSLAGPPALRAPDESGDE